MPLASRIGIDTAGGGALLPTLQQTFATISGLPWATVGVRVADHGSGSHNAATVPTGSSVVSIGGLPAVVAGTPATCGHVTTGSGHVVAAV